MFNQVGVLQVSVMKRQIHTWDVCVIADKIRWLGRVDADDERSAIAEGAEKFDKDPKKLIVVRRTW